MQKLNNKLNVAELMASGRGLWRADGSPSAVLPPHVKIPELCGDFSIRIDKKGQWFYQHSPIGRIALCQLFAVCLLKQGDEYFLATPAERGKILVEDLPFYANHCQTDANNNFLQIESSLGFAVNCDAEHPLVVEFSQQQPKPKILVRDNLWMRISPKVYYDICLMALNQQADQPEAEIQPHQPLMLQAGGAEFFVGYYE